MTTTNVWGVLSQKGSINAISSGPSTYILWFEMKKERLRKNGGGRVNK